MGNLILLTILFASLGFPVVFARASDPRRGLTRMIVAILLFHAVYVLYVTRLHVHLFIPQRG